MAFFIRSVMIRLKLLWRASFLSVLLLFPIAVFILGHLWEAKGNKIKIGLLYEEGTPAAAIADIFQAYVNRDADCVIFTGKGELEKAVAVQDVECGYVLERDLKITLYKGPLTISDEIFNIMLASALVETLSGELGAQVLQSYFPGNESLAEDIQARADTYAAVGPAMELRTVLVSPEEEARGAATTPLSSRADFRGLTALFGFLLSALCAGASGEDGFVYDRLRAMGQREAFLYMWASAFVTFFLSLALFALSVDSALLLQNLLITLFYCLSLAGFSLLLARYAGKNTVGLIPLLFIVTACLGQTLIRVEEFAAFLEPFTYFTLTRYYMEGIQKARPLFEVGVFIFVFIVCAVLCTWRGFRRPKIPAVFSK